jgi:glycosyltransferase involved in cell wall biosynthesis
MTEPTKAPWLSIVTITRNDLEGLRRTRKSVEDQDFENIEHLVIDGASTDGTASWLGSITSPNLVWISEPDAGVYDAMNKGASRARGQFIVFLNSGDVYWRSDVISSLRREYERSHYRWTYSRAIFVDKNRVPTRPAYGLRFYSPMSHAYKRLAICHQTVVMEKSLFDSLGGFNQEFGLVADYALLLAAGRAVSPRVRRELDIGYLDGGSSAVNPNMEHEKHRVRVVIFKMGQIKRSADLAYTKLQKHYVSSRRIAKRVLVASGAGSFLRRLASRDQ